MLLVGLAVVSNIVKSTTRYCLKKQPRSTYGWCVTLVEVASFNRIRRPTRMVSRRRILICAVVCIAECYALYFGPALMRHLHWGGTRRCYLGT